MSKTARADFAPNSTWAGLQGKPNSFGVSDIGGLTGNGYADGQIPVYNRAAGRFRPGSRTPASTTPTPTTGPATFIEVWASWDVPSLHALQTATEDFYINGAFPSQPVMVGAPYDDQFVQISATIVDLNIARISVTNFGLADLDLGEGQYRLRIFTP